MSELLITLLASTIALIIGICIGVYGTMEYIRREIMEDATPFDGKELERLKKFVRYKGKSE